VFPSLAHPAGCAELMRAIRAKSGFCPAATWLVVDEQAGEGCGTVQGLSDGSGCGAIQNLGVVPARRGMGLGTALMLKALAGFWQAGLRRASLEVTASNEPAVRMYRRLGFRCHKTVYRAVERVGLGRPPAPHGPERPEPVMAEGEVGR
ncbi:MAG TPA: GNAT family N-acetyltransferase, partial [Gemmataceae bacterium]